jgi:hypothetical protein
MAMLHSRVWQGTNSESGREKSGISMKKERTQSRKRSSSFGLPIWMSGTRGSSRALWGDALLDEKLVQHLEEPVGLGFRLRAQAVGPEQQLVDQFLSQQEFRLPPGRRLTVIPQPAVETGFPDLVAVVWKPSATAYWKRDRLKLIPQDIQLLHLLSCIGWTDLMFLKTLFRRGLYQSLDRLGAADLILVGTHKCRSRTLKNIFAVERIIAVEAKISSWRRAVEQARNNLWFSSESHVLLPEKRSISSLIAEVDTFGIGVLGQFKDGTNQHRKPEVQQVPTSYGSWLFNEWVWRIAVHQEQI